MAGEKSLIRRIVAIFDRASAAKVEQQLEQSLGDAGKKGGENFLRELKKQFDQRTADLKVQLAKGLIDEREFRKQADAAAKAFNAGIIKGMDEARAAGTLTEREYAKLARQLKKTGQEGETWFGRMRAAAVRLGAAMAAAFTLRRIVEFGKASLKAAADSDAVWRNLAGSVEAAGVEFKEAEPKIRAAADQFERLTTFDDDQYAETLQRLIALTDDYAASVQNVGLVADVAARFFEGDLAPAADLVGRAMTGNLRALKQLGIDAETAQEALDELARRSMGAAAERADTLRGKLDQLSVQWGNFQKAVGQALAGAGSSTAVLDVLIGTLRGMSEWVTKNADTISHLGNLLAWLAPRAMRATAVFTPMLAILAGLAKAYAFVARGAALAGQAMGADTAAIEKNIQEVDKLAASLWALTKATAATLAGPGQFSNVTGTSSSTADKPDRPAVAAGIVDEDAEKKAKAIADHIAAIEREIDVQKRRAEAIAQGQAAVEALNRELFIEEQILRSGVEAGSAAEEEIRRRAGALYDATQAVELLSKDALNASNAMSQLAQAFKEGGVAGAIALAKTAFLKIKEHIASAVSEGAKALGALGSGNFWSAAKHAASAVQHGLAVNEWRKLAMGGGGSGAGSGAGAGAGAGGMGPGSAAGIDRAGGVEPPGTEVHIYMDPLSPQDPRVQEFHAETARQVADRYGANAHVTWHPRAAGGR